jgi:hypothetical protein
MCRLPLMAALAYTQIRLNTIRLCQLRNLFALTKRVGSAGFAMCHK